MDDLVDFIANITDTREKNRKEKAYFTFAAMMLTFCVTQNSYAFCRSSH